VENTAPALERYGYATSGVTAVAGGNFRVKLTAWNKNFSLGKYKDIHCPCFDAGFKYVQGGGGEAQIRQADQVWRMATGSSSI
jgi:hypothetical protein